MLAGRSNVGKSTLLNALIGTKLSIVTPKPQTTRRPVRGILHRPEGQIVFVDTPGVFLGKKDAVSNRLTEFVRETLEGVDAIIYVVDPTRAPGPEETFIQELLGAAPIPIILALNKSDLPLSARRFRDTYLSTNIPTHSTFEVSAVTHANVNRLIETLFSLLPRGEAYYPEQQLTDLSHGEWLAELIREKTFLALKDELPYSIHVFVEEQYERPDESTYIEATIWTTEERYKRMVIGAKGSMIKKIGMDVRKELEAIFQNKVYLALDVRVDPKWQERFQ